MARRSKRTTVPAATYSMGETAPAPQLGGTPLTRFQRGFTLIELMVAMAVLLIITGAVFQLLSQSQQRSTTAATVEEATAMLRDTMDQMIREIRLAGYPPEKSYPCPPPVGATYGACLTYLNSGYVAGGILIANDYSIQFEADTDGDNIAEVFDYELRVPAGEATGGCATVAEDAILTTPTLMRSAVVKNADGSVPAADFQPFLENVRNCELGTPVPIFTYCAAPAFPPPAPPWSPGGGCPEMSYMATSALLLPRNTRIVMLRLQVQSAVRDPQSGQFQNIEQFGLADRVNPD
ncbi:MAG: type II secretion system protein [Acidobacteria bacterium]|nr:type II secretion system protein [Acidobacteriota bacterium]